MCPESAHRAQCPQCLLIEEVGEARVESLERCCHGTVCPDTGAGTENDEAELLDVQCKVGSGLSDGECGGALDLRLVRG